MNVKIEPNPSKQSVLKNKEHKITHLYFNDKYLKKIPKVTNLRNVVVFYLHNNEIFEISNLENAENLSSLYLQKNRILKIENLDKVKNLRKLYLGHNTISVVEGLENMQLLEELYLEKQYLLEGNSLCFDPRTIYGLSQSLQVLNISHNKIQTISSLSPLRMLRVLNASNNDLSDIEEVCEIIKEWFYLKELTLAHNPICKNRLYKESIIADAYCLESLDQKTISATTRSFLKRLHGERVAHRLRKNINLAHKIHNVPKNYSSAIQKAVSVQVLKQHQELCDDEIFDEKNAVYIPWKTLPKPSVVKVVKKPKTTTPKHQNSFVDLKI